MCGGHDLVSICARGAGLRAGREVLAISFRPRWSSATMRGARRRKKRLSKKWVCGMARDELERSAWPNQEELDPADRAALRPAAVGVTVEEALQKREAACHEEIVRRVCICSGFRDC